MRINLKGKIFMLYFILIIVILVIIYVLALYNSFIKLDNKVEEAFSTMDVYLKKRWELIPNLAEVVKGYSKHEKETLTKIIDLRNKTYDDLSNNEKIKKNEVLSNGLNKFIVLAENYPDLKASSNYKDLSDKLTKVNDDIANSRKYYNGCVRIYNNKVEMFPNNIFAKLFGYKSKLMFEASNEEKKNINVKL